MARPLALVSWLWHQSFLPAVEAQNSIIHVAGKIEMYASQPAALQDANATSALKGAVVASLSEVDTGMDDLVQKLGEIELFVLAASGRRLSAPLGRRANSPTAMIVEYRIILPPHQGSAMAAYKIVESITAKPINMVFLIHQAVMAAKIPTLVANVKVLPPKVEHVSRLVCVFRYLRFMPVEVRDPKKAQGAALSQMIFYDAGMYKLSVKAGGNSAVAMHALGNSESTNDWSSGELRPLEIDLGVEKDLAFYHWKTANGASSANDPVRWRLEVSTDQKTWDVVDDRALRRHATPTNRRTSSGMFKINCDSVKARTKQAGANDDIGSISPLAATILVLFCLVFCATCVGSCVYYGNRFLNAHKKSKVLPIDGSQGQLEPSKTHEAVASPSLGSFANIFYSGQKVVIAGLTDRTEHNGTFAEVIKFDAQKNKYMVRIENSGKKVFLNPGNVAAVQKDEGDFAPATDFAPAATSSTFGPAATTASHWQ